MTDFEPNILGGRLAAYLAIGVAVIAIAKAEDFDLAQSLEQLSAGLASVPALALEYEITEGFSGSDQTQQAVSRIILDKEGRISRRIFEANNPDLPATAIVFDGDQSMGLQAGSRLLKTASGFRRDIALFMGMFDPFFGTLQFLSDGSNPFWFATLPELGDASNWGKLATAIKPDEDAAADGGDAFRFRLPDVNDLARESGICERRVWFDRKTGYPVKFRLDYPERGKDHYWEVEVFKLEELKDRVFIPAQTVTRVGRGSDRAVQYAQMKLTKSEIKPEFPIERFQIDPLKHGFERIYDLDLGEYFSLKEPGVSK